MKKYFKEKFTKQNMKQFFAKRGFYVLLLVCLAGAAVGTLMTSQEQGEPGASPAPSGQQVVQNQDETLQSAKENQQGQGSQSPSPSPSPAPSVAPIQKILLPVDGTRLKPFSSDKPQYNSTLDEWSLHLAVDIAAKEGTKVKAAQSGVVEEVKSDALMGHMLVITADDGSKTVYASLQKKPTVKKGDKVKQGQVIGLVGRTAAFEVMDGSHLHFEYIVKGVKVDPEKYFIKQPESTPAPSTKPTASPSPAPSATPKPSPSATPKPSAS